MTGSGQSLAWRIPDQGITTGQVATGDGLNPRPARSAAPRHSAFALTLPLHQASALARSILPEVCAKRYDAHFPLAGLAANLQKSRHIPPCIRGADQGLKQEAFIGQPLLQRLVR